MVLDSGRSGDHGCIVMPDAIGSQVNLVRTPEGGQKWQRVGLHTPACVPWAQPRRGTVGGGDNIM